MFRRTLLVALIAAATTTVLSAAGKPDFSGFWKLNASKSDFGPIPAPDKMERTITHADPSLKVKSVQVGQRGEVTTDATYKTDGSESTNDFRGTPVKSVAKWEGDKLTISYKRETPNGAVDIKELWSLSEDGKTMTVDLAITAPQGELAVKNVFDKADAPAAKEAPATKEASGASATANAAAPAAAATAGGAKPNFSGKWKLNVAKSDFGPIPPPEKQESTVEHTDPVLKTTSNQVGAEGEVTTVVTLSTDGKESKNDIRGNPMVSTAAWEGKSLVVNSKLDFQGMEIKIKQWIEMSEDGKTMTQKQLLSTPQGDFEIKMLSERVN